MCSYTHFLVVEDRLVMLVLDNVNVSELLCFVANKLGMLPDPYL